MPYKRISAWLIFAAALCGFTGWFLQKRLILDAAFFLMSYGISIALFLLAIVLLVFRSGPFLQSKAPIFGKILRWVEGPAIAATTIIGMLVFAEITLRAFNQQPSFNNNGLNTNSEINIDQDGHRVTINQPENALHTIYIFGGSTVFCIDVDDQHTIPSYLQTAINEDFGNKYKVINMGIPALPIAGQWTHLQELPLAPGDIIIWFDGYNEILDAFRLQYTEPELLYERFYIYRRYISPIITRGMPNSAKRIGNIAYENLMHFVPKANTYVLDQGAEFIHFLQPSVYTIEQPNQYEQNLLANYENNYYGWVENFSYGYDKLILANQDLQALGVLSIDLTYAFDHDYRTTSEEIFIDDIHVNQYGNQILANEIYKHLLETGLLEN